MKKLLVLLTVASLLLGLTSCFASPESKLIQAMERTNALESSQTNMFMSIEAEASDYGVSLDAEVNGTFSYAAVDGAHLFRGSIDFNMLGQDNESEFFYDGTYLYYEPLGVKIKQALSFEEAAENVGVSTQNISLTQEDIVDPVIKEENGLTVYSFSISSERFSELMEGNSSIEGMSDIDDVKFTVEVKNGYMTKFSIVFGAKMAYEFGDLSVEVVMTTEYINPGEPVTVTPPTDLDKYIENPLA